MRFLFAVVGSKGRILMLGGKMRVKLTFIERDFRGTDLSSREEVLVGESKKTPTRNHVARLIAAHHPELKTVTQVMLISATETGHKWYVKASRITSNRWLYVYADPLEDVVAEANCC